MITTTARRTRIALAVGLILASTCLGNSSYAQTENVREAAPGKIYDNLVVLTVRPHASGPAEEYVRKLNEEGVLENTSINIDGLSTSAPIAMIAMSFDLSSSDPGKKLAELGKLTQNLGDFGEMKFKSFVGSPVDLSITSLVMNQEMDLIKAKRLSEAQAAANRFELALLRKEATENQSEPNDAWNVLMVGADGKPVVLPHVSSSEDACNRSIEKGRENLARAGAGADDGSGPKEGAAGSALGAMTADSVRSAVSAIAMTCIPVYAR